MVATFRTRLISAERCMTASLSRSFNSTSDQDTTTSLNQSPEVSSRALLPLGLFANALRYRRSSNKRRPSFHSPPTKPASLKQGEMFNTRKYTPLPTNSYGPRKRAGGGMTAWKRWILVGGAVCVLLFVGFSYSGPSKTALDYNSESE